MTLVFNVLVLAVHAVTIVFLLYVLFVGIRDILRIRRDR